MQDFMSKPLEPDLLQAQLQVAERILELRYEMGQLQSLLPICSYCKKIRDAEDAWTSVENFIAEQTGTNFTHSICPDVTITWYNQSFNN